MHGAARHSLGCEMIIPFGRHLRGSSAGEPDRSFEVWAFIGDFRIFSLLYGEADASDAPAYFAASLFEALADSRFKSIRDSELAIWCDGLPLDRKRWMFFATTSRLTADHLAILHHLAVGSNGWFPVGRIPTLSDGAVPMYEFEGGVKYLLLSDVLIGDDGPAVAHPVVNCGDVGLSLSFGVFPPHYRSENRLYLGNGQGVCFKTKSAQALRPKKVYCIPGEQEGMNSNCPPPAL